MSSKLSTLINVDYSKVEAHIVGYMMEPFERWLPLPSPRKGSTTETTIGLFKVEKDRRTKCFQVSHKGVRISTRAHRLEKAAQEEARQYFLVKTHLVASGNAG